jgi:hypothetical protein
VSAEVAGEETSGKIIIVADRVPDDHSDLLVSVEILCWFSLTPRLSTGGRRSADGKADCND